MAKLTRSLPTNHICEELHRSIFFSILKYPILYLSTSGIYVPHFCARNSCRTTDNTNNTVSGADQERQTVKLTTTGENRTNIKFNSPLVFVTPHNITDHQLNNELNPKDYVINERPGKLKHVEREKETDGLSRTIAAEPISTGYRKSAVTYFKVVFCCVYFTVELLDISRLIYVTTLTFSDNNEFVYFLTSVTFRIFVLFLNASSSVTNFIHFRPTCCAWLDYERKYGLKTELKISRRGTRIFFAVGISTNITIFVIILLGILTSLQAIRLQAWPLDMDDSFSKVTAAVFCACMGFFGSSNTISSHMIRAKLTYALIQEFHHLRNRMSEILAEPLMHGQAEEEFCMFVEQLRLLKEVAQKSFHVVKHTIAASYIFTPVLLSLVLYNLAAGNMVWNQTMLTMYMVVTVLLMITGTTILCAQLQSEARSVWSAVYMVPWCQLSPAMLEKLSIFVCQLSVDDVSYSVYGMFTVNYSSLMMVSGTVLTYGIFVLQLTMGKKQ